jgi:putative SOS response-associated peptidase YedK
MAGLACSGATFTAMCGRYSLSLPPEELEALFDAQAPANLPPRYNIAPTQDVLIAKKKKLELARWGLIGSAKMINARQETAFEKSPFKSAIKQQRCLVPADSFFEWKKLAGGIKQPFRIMVRDHDIFAMAGIFAKWKSPAGEWVETCSILTTSANEMMQEVHDRMPVILARESWELWLDQTVRVREPLEHLFLPFPAEQMKMVAVSRRVNNAHNDDPSCLSEVEVEAAEKEEAPRKQLGFDFS